MTPLFKKLNFKEHNPIVIVNAPDSFLPELDEMGHVTSIAKSLDDVEKASFFMVFVTQKEEIDRSIEIIASKTEGDALVWYCYPKGSSKRYTCDFNRDTGWEKLGEFNFEGVRQVAIDEDWSALRFRNASFIKKMTRRKDFAMSKEGKSKTSGKWRNVFAQIAVALTLYP